MKIYSPQMLNTYNECPAKYYYRFVKNTPVPQLDNSFITGKNIHAMAAYYLRGEDVSLFSLTEKENIMWERLKTSCYFNLKPEKVEQNIAAKLDNFWIGGRLDALVKNNNQEYFILDYKTGEIPQNAKYNFQTIVYLLCCDKLIKEYKSLNFVYISVKTGEEKVLEFSNNLKAKYELRVKEIINGIQKMSEPNIIHTEKCKNCQYSKICV